MSGSTASVTDPCVRSIGEDEWTSSPLNVVLLKNSQPHSESHTADGKHFLNPVSLHPRGRSPTNPGVIQRKRCVSETDINQTKRQQICSGVQKSKKEEDFSSSGVCLRNKMSKPNYSGTFHMVEQDNMDAYLEALGNTPFFTFLQLLHICNH